MATRLVTIATFDLPIKAEIARNALTAAAIQSVIADDNAVGMDWLLGNAIGWVKVQVREEDADRAVTVLEEALGTGGAVDPEELAAEAESSAPEDEPDLRDRNAPASPLSDAYDAAPVPDSRDEYARRVFFAGWLGILIPLIPFYALYLFMNAAFSPGTLSPRGRRNLTIGGITVLCGLVLDYIYFAYLTHE